LIFSAFKTSLQALICIKILAPTYLTCHHLCVYDVGEGLAELHT